MPKVQDELMGAAEASKLTGLDRRTIHRKVQRGELVPVSKLPGLRGAYIFRRADIEALVSTDVPTPVYDGGGPRPAARVA